jgi:hypothetical protein
MAHGSLIGTLSKFTQFTYGIYLQSAELDQTSFSRITERDIRYV